MTKLVGIDLLYLFLTFNTPLKYKHNLHSTCMPKRYTHVIIQPVLSSIIRIKPKRQPHKMVKHTQTIHRFLPTNCLSLFDHFWGLALKEF